MQAFESSEGVVTHAGPKDKWPRSTRIARVEIDCRMDGQIVSGGHILKKGKQTLSVRAADVPGILAQAWDEDEPKRIEQAVRAQRREMLKDLRTTFAPDLNDAAFAKHVDEVQAIPHDDRDTDQKDLMRALEDAGKTTPHSVESCFFAEHSRGINPFVSVKVLETDLSLPEEEEKIMHDKAQLASLVSLLKEASGNKEIDQLRETVAALQLTVSELQGQLRGKKG